MEFHELIKKILENIEVSEKEYDIVEYVGSVCLLDEWFRSGVVKTQEDVKALLSFRNKVNDYKNSLTETTNIIYNSSSLCQRLHKIFYVDERNNEEIILAIYEASAAFFFLGRELEKASEILINFTIGL